MEGLRLRGPIKGKLPRRALSLVVKWAGMHRAELLKDWDLACRSLPLASIAPLE